MPSPASQPQSRPKNRSLLHNFRKVLARFRVYVGAVSLIIIILATGLYSLTTQQRLGSEVSRLINVNARLAQDLDEVRSATDRLKAALVLRLANDEEKAREFHAKTLEIFPKRIESLQERAESLPDELAEKISSLTGKLEDIATQAQNFFDIEANDSLEEQILEWFALQLSPLILEFADVLGDVQVLNYEMIAEGGDATLGSIVRGVRLVMFLVLVAAVGVLYGTYIYAFRVFRPVQRLSRAIRQLALGQSNKELPKFSEKELGAFARPLSLVSRSLEHKRRQAERKLNRLHQTLEACMASLAHPLFILNAQGDIILVNPAGGNFLAAIGLSAEHEALPDSLGEVVRAMGEDNTGPRPCDLAGALAFNVNGSERFFIPRATRLIDERGRLHGFTLLLEDVTDIRLIDQLRSNLIGVIGHELQTPMTVIRMALHLLRKNAYEGLSEENKEVLQSALDDTETLQKTLQNLLDLNRIDSQGIGLNRSRWTAKRDLPATVQRYCRTRNADPGFVDLEVPEGLPELTVDRDRLDHAFMNILANAHRFSPPEKPVRVQAAELPDAWVRITVADEGPGIPEKFHARLFEPFFRVPGQNDDGAGLGLCIAERIIRMHGGRILVESSVNRGTAFHVDLPPPAKS